MSKLHDVDFVVLSQGRLIKRRNRAIRQAWVRLMASALAASPKRFLQLVDEARTILNKEHKNIFDIEQADKKRNKEKLS